MRIDATKFVEMWMAGASVQDIAAALSMGSRHVSVYATQLRKRGVNLPKRNGSPVNVDALNEIVKRGAT